MGMITGTSGIFSTLSRTSGLSTAAGGLLLGIVGVLVFVEGQGNFLTAAVGIGLFGVSIMLLLYSVKQFKDPDYKDSGDHTAGSQLEGNDVAQRLQSTPRPYYVCTRCRVLFEKGVCHGICLRCDSVSECLKVETDEDVATAISGVG